jgi:hypothetical protein
MKTYRILLEVEEGGGGDEGLALDLDLVKVLPAGRVAVGEVGAEDAGVVRAAGGDGADEEEDVGEGGVALVETVGVLAVEGGAVEDGEVEVAVEEEEGGEGVDEVGRGEVEVDGVEVGGAGAGLGVAPEGGVGAGGVGAGVLALHVDGGLDEDEAAGLAVEAAVVVEAVHRVGGLGGVVGGHVGEVAVGGGRGLGELGEGLAVGVPGLAVHVHAELLCEVGVGAELRGGGRGQTDDT